MLYIVRHGEIDFNKENRYAGSTDVELNELGIKQAKEVVEKLRGLKIDLIITSPLKRCIVMAEMIKNITHKPIVVMDEFRERGVGVFEGLTRDEAKNRHPELWARNITRIYDDAPPGGETIRQVEERVFVGLNKIKDMKEYKNIVLVTHAFVAKAIHKFFNTNMTEDEFYAYKLENGQIVSYNL